MMRTPKWAPAMALALTLPAAASAQSEDLLECTTQGVTPAFRDKLADAMLDNSAASDGMFEQLATVAAECAGRNGLGEDKREAYFTYSLSRLPRDAFIVRLGAAGISAAVIDDALDFGPERSNPVITGGLDKAQLDRLLGQLAAAGVDVDAVAEGSWAMVGAYAAASSLMWQARRQLR